MRNAFLVLVRTDLPYDDMVAYASERGIEISSIPVEVEAEGQGGLVAEFEPRRDVLITMELVNQFYHQDFDGICNDGIREFITEIFNKGYSYLHEVWFDSDMMNRISNANASAYLWIKDKLS